MLTCTHEPKYVRWPGSIYHSIGYTQTESHSFLNVWSLSADYFSVTYLSSPKSYCKLYSIKINKTSLTWKNPRELAWHLSKSVLSSSASWSLSFLFHLAYLWLRSSCLVRKESQLLSALIRTAICYLLVPVGSGPVSCLCISFFSLFNKCLTRVSPF